MKSIDGEATGAVAETRPAIEEPYVLFVCVPVEKDANGRRWTDELWAKDLALHLDYLDDLTLASPTKPRVTAKLVSLDEPPFDRLKFVDLPCPSSKLEVLKTYPMQFIQYWRAVGSARIVHTGFAGWPVNQGWLAVPLAKLRGRFVLANVESSPWRISVPGAPWRKRFRAGLGEWWTRFCLRIADMRIVTSKAYLDELLPPNSPRAYVTPATWLNEDWILSNQEAEQAWAAKQGPVRLLFAARLVAEKGVEVLLEAVKRADAAGSTAKVSIIGSGPLLEKCQAFAATAVGQKCVDVLEPVAYGEPFLELMRAHDAVLVPSLSSEQPRILYDAFSQAVPAIASNTGGICEIAEQGVTARLCPPGDAAALADALVWAGENRAELHAMGAKALESVRDSTHEATHKRRHQLLLENLVARA